MLLNRINKSYTHIWICFLGDDSCINFYFNQVSFYSYFLAYMFTFYFIRYKPNMGTQGVIGVPHLHFFYLYLVETCPKCEHPRAYFMQIQTRSADEPMTTFYKCCNAQCGHRWRDWNLCTLMYLMLMWHRLLPSFEPLFIAKSFW